MRWLFHIRRKGDYDEPYAPGSLTLEGFVHASFRDDVQGSARLYFADAARDALEVLQIDPRRVGVRVEMAETPRGVMPHIFGPIPSDACRATLPLSAFEPEGSPPPDRVTGTRVAFVAFEGMTLLDVVGVYDPLSRIASMGFDPSARSEIIGAHSERVWAHDGAEVVVQRVRPPLSEFDLVVVPGGPATRSLVRDASLVEWLGRFPHNRLLASVCTGSLLLGAAGRLKGKRATTHHTALALLGQYGATVVHERVVDEGTIVTAGGVTSAIDLGLHLVRRLEGVETANRVAEQMEVTWWR